MKNKLMMFVLLGMILLSVSSVSAFELNPFADKKIYEPTLKEDVSDFIKQDFNEQYGVIKLSKTFFWIDTDKVAEYSLIENTEQCLINCEARGKAVLYSPGKLFDDLNFIDKRGLSLDINAKYLIKTIETYEVEVPDTYKEVCEKVASNLTKGDYENSCYEVVDSYKKETRENEVWVEYKGEELKAGEYEWKVQGTKSPTKAIDFIPTARGKAFNEWAWWDGHWGFKRKIEIQENKGLTLINYGKNISIDTASLISDGKLQSNCQDVRFTNEDESQELKWVNLTACNSANTIFQIEMNISQSVNTTIYFYYGNSGATNPNYATNLFWDNTNKIISQNLMNVTFGTSNTDIPMTLLFKNYGTTLNMGGTGVNNAGSIGFNSRDISVSLIENTPSKMTILYNYAIRNNGGGSNWLAYVTEKWEFEPFKPYAKVTINSTYSSVGDWNRFLRFSTASTNINYSATSTFTTTTTSHNNEAGNFGESGQLMSQINGTNVWFDYRSGQQIGISSLSTFPTTQIYPAWSRSDTYYCTAGGGNNCYGVGLHINNQGTNAGALTFYITAGETSNFFSIGENYNYFINNEENAESVIVALNSPINAFNSSSQTIDFNATITPTKADLINVTFRAGDIIETTSISGNESLVYNWTKTFADGDYSWNVTACGEGESTAILCSTTASRNFTIDTIPPSLTLNSPLTNFTTLTLPINVTLNFTATDSHLSSCWYNYNGTNTTLTCNTTQTINVTTSGAHSIDYYSNDTFGNLASGTAPFYVYYITRNATATNPITEGGISSHSFYLNMTDITNFNATAELYWNGTSQGLGTKTTLSNNALRFDKNIVVPSINGTSVNWTWVYNISGNPNVTDYNLTGSQTYIKVNISECGAGTYQILNYTLYDQDTRALGSTANASIEVDLTLTSQANDSLSWQYHSTKSSATSFLICLPSGALNNSAYNLDSVSKYTYQDHVIQYHYIESFNLTNDSIPQTIRLYPLSTAKSTSFLVNYQDENYIYVENAVIDVWRRYVGDGVFFSVEHGKTDANGQTRLHLVTEDIIYKFLVWQDGELVYTSPEFLALCQATPCQINLRQSTEDTAGFSERDNLIYDYDFNKTTRTASFTFATKDNTQTEINMTILSSNQYENDTACTTSLTTSGGQIDCAIPLAYTNTSYQTIIYQDGQYFGTAFDSLTPNSMEIFGYTGLILTAISYLMLALMGISSGIATIIFGIIGLVFMGIIQIFESGNVFGMASAIIWLIVAGIIIIIKITKRRIQ